MISKGIAHISKVEHYIWTLYICGMFQGLHINKTKTHIGMNKTHKNVIANRNPIIQWYNLYMRFVQIFKQ